MECDILNFNNAKTMKIYWKYIYWTMVFLFIFSVIIEWEKEMPANPLAIKSITSDFASAMVFFLLGISMIFNYEAMTNWLRDNFQISLPNGRFRLLGVFFLCASLLPIALSVNKFLVYLGIISNSYAP